MELTYLKQKLAYTKWLNSMVCSALLRPHIHEFIKQKKVHKIEKSELDLMVSFVLYVHLFNSLMRLQFAQETDFFFSPLWK